MTHHHMQRADAGRNQAAEIVTVDFHGSRLATFMANGEPYVAMRPIVEGMGLSWGTQRGKLHGQASKFSCAHMNTTGADGKTYRMLSMPVRKLNLWLATINPNKIKDAEKRAVIEVYQEESANALHAYWNKGIAIRDDYDGVITDIDPKVMTAIGGMVKGIVGRALSEIVPALVHQHLAEKEIGVVHGVTAYDVTIMAGVTDRKGLRGLGQFVSNRLRMVHAQKGVPVKLRDHGSLGTALVYDKLTAREWLASGGRSEIDRYIEGRRGQVPLRLVS